MLNMKDIDYYTLQQCIVNAASDTQKEAPHLLNGADAGQGCF
jgi:hypothetical protein